MEDIKNDNRHEVLNMLCDEHVEERRFPSWHMHNLTKEELVQVRLENVLLDYLTLYIDQNNKISETSRNSIWRIINKLSQFNKFDRL